jgi:hypothetical protein
MCSEEYRDREHKLCKELGWESEDESNTIDPQQVCPAAVWHTGVLLPCGHAFRCIPEVLLQCRLSWNVLMLRPARKRKWL